MYKTTAVLTAVLALLVTYLYFVELRSAKEKLEDGEHVLSFSEAAVTQVAITGGEGGAGDITIQAGGPPETPFLITTPIETVADTGTVSALIRQLANLKPVQTIQQVTSDTDRAPFGLDQPAYSVRIHLTGEDSDLLLIGGENIKGQVYAQVGNTVYLVDSTIVALLRRGLDDWRRRELFNFVTSDVKSIQLHGPEGKLLFENRNAKWMLKTSVDETEADSSTVMNLVRNVSFLRGEGFIDEDKEARIAAWGDPVLKVALSFEGAQPQQEGALYRDPNEPDFIYGVTTSKAPLYKVAADRFDEINKPASFFMPKKPEAAGDLSKAGSL